MTSPAVLLLRAAETAANDVATCVAQGFEPVLMSPLRLQPDVAALARLSAIAAPADVIFWVSPGAVHVAAALLPALRDNTHVAVGAATAQALRAHGGTQIVCPSDGHDSEAVLRLPLWQDRLGRLLVVRGSGGRDTLATALRQRGWAVTVAEVYQRVPHTVDGAVLMPYLQTGRLRAVYVAAASMLEAWWAQMPLSLHGSLQSLLYLTHHERVAATLRHHGFSVAVVDTLAHGLANLNQTGSRTP